MSKNGAFFISILESEQSTPSVWDPYSYRNNGLGKNLGDYVTVTKLGRSKNASGLSLFYPIEYRNILRGKYLTFVLEFSQGDSVPECSIDDKQQLLFNVPVYHRGVSNSKYPMVGEQELLFGTMRAYLGNVLVTPKAEWIGCKSPLLFPVKSEFVCVAPDDSCVYFWWAYLRSPDLLKNLPLGSGGTRPRLRRESFLQTPVKVPRLETRQVIHERLKESAEREWKEYITRMQIMDSLNL